MDKLLDTKLSRNAFLRGAALGGGLLATAGSALIPASANAGAGDGAAEPEISDREKNQYADEVNAGLADFRELADKQVMLAEQLAAAVQSGDLARAQTAYVESRPPYEQIEVLAASFPATDSDLDARPYAFAAGALSDEFVGFHRIEALIYRDQDLDTALPYAKGLVASARNLQKDLQKRDNFSAKKNFGGMIGLSTEVASKKISSEEETWSDQSILIFRENWRGIHSQYKPFARVIEKRNPQVAGEVTKAHKAAMDVIAPHVRPDQVAVQPYSSVPMKTRDQIVAASYRYRKALIQATEVLGLT